MARTYKRDKNGRFAGGGGSSKKPAKKTQKRGTNRIRRDNAGKIQGIGGTGATGRGGRLRTAKGNKRVTVTMQAKGATPRGAIKGKVRRDPGAMAKMGKAKAAAKAPPSPQRKAMASKSAQAARPARKPLDQAKVQRIIARAGSNVDRPGKFNRLSAVKGNNFRETRSRALDYLNKAAGLQVKKKGGRPENPKNLTRDQMLANIASNKPTRRSTLKNRSKDVERRTQKRKETAGLFGKDAPMATYSNNFNAAKSGRKGSLRVIPDSPARAKGQGPVYATGTGVVFTGRKGFRSKATAATAQRSKRLSVGKLAGTARKSGPTSLIKRGKAIQPTLTGGRSVTYGRARFASRRPRLATRR